MAFYLSVHKINKIHKLQLYHHHSPEEKHVVKKNNNNKQCVESNKEYNPDLQ